MMHPLDPEWEHYGDPDREIWSLDKFQPELFPENVCHLTNAISKTSLVCDESYRKAGCGKTARPV